MCWFLWNCFLMELFDLVGQINITQDRLETIPCLDVIPDDRDDWEERFCDGVNPKTKNHRIVIDGQGSDTVYNGHTYKNDLMYTRANKYISGISHWFVTSLNWQCLSPLLWSLVDSFCQKSLHCN